MASAADKDPFYLRYVHGPCQCLGEVDPNLESMSPEQILVRHRVDGEIKPSRILI